MPRIRVTRVLGRRCGRRRTSGQALVETIIALTIVMTIVLGLINLAMLASTRHMLNFAAFSAARAAVYGRAGDPQDPDSVVRTVVDRLPRGTRLQDAGEDANDDYVVTVWAPFSYPMSGTGGRSMVRSKAPMYVQPDIPEVGDNARQ
jgi:hypothetical protein